MQTLTKPAVITSPFAADGLKNTIPQNPSGDYHASVTQGFPPITMQPISQGGTPPDGKDFNGVFNLMSQFYFAFQNGWYPTFDADVSDAIGGYAQNAILWYTPAGTNNMVPLKSLVPNNTYNFNTNPAYIGQYWSHVITGDRTNTLLDFKFVDHILDDPNWVRADTFDWQSGVEYVVAYESLAAQLANVATSSTETIGDLTITFYRAANGWKIVLPDQESNLQSLYENTGVAWYYVVDTANKRFKLPRSKWAFTGLRDTVGSYVEAGLPDHNHSYTEGYNSGGNAGGSYHGTATFKTSTTGLASSQNPIYGNSDTVQPRATQCYLYFYVGNFKLPDDTNVVDIINALNGKIDLPAGAAQSDFDFVVETQLSSESNGYTWYRKYKSGWVQGGGYVPTQTNRVSPMTITLPVEMADTNYNFLSSMQQHPGSSAVLSCLIYSKATTSIQVSTTYATNNSGGNSAEAFYWEIHGMAKMVTSSMTPSFPGFQE